jgi:predicted ribosome quality control (RQC) complex YloA/Tae2 family protein
MEVFFIAAVVAELARYRGAQINKIYQPTAEEIVLRLWTGRETVRLLLSATPGGTRLHLTSASTPNPATPPRFCQLLRARLALLTAVEQIPGERIVRLQFRGEEQEEVALMVELTGRQSNLLLLDDQGRIIDALRRVEGGARPVLPGHLYRLPPAPPRHPLEGASLLLPANIGADAEEFRRWLVAEVSPMSPTVARELAARVAKGNPAGQVLQDFADDWRAGRFQPQIATVNGQPLLSAFPLQALPVSEQQLFASASAAADAFYATPLAQIDGLGSRTELEKAVRKERARLASRLMRIDQEESKQSGYERDRHHGELLLANLHLLRKGLQEIVLDDWYQDPPQPVRISLEPHLTPVENAERYFRRHRKGRRGAEHLQRRREETLQEQHWLEGVAMSLEETHQPEELLALRRELEGAGLLRPRPEPGNRRRSAPPATGVRQALTPGGFRLFWGKSHTANDHVSRQLTAADDLWFHAAHRPGCHLVLKRGGHAGAIPEEDQLYAAAIAAGHSRGGADAKVEVLVTEGKWVRKPRGARPGMVTVQHSRTVMVAPQVHPGESPD